ncbi:MAG: 30S ribosomal protein S7 [Alphaproteobacteria bacterium]|nr:30S ribosomal protein S7 [Alphaproteobacteria bacterium]MCB9696117.1 30S ribosomal protein S7 [Alphaproteobacteria bacterium]
MPRRRVIAKRRVLPDPKFNDQLVTKFMNVVMEQGKKHVAEKIVYGSFDVIHNRTREDPLMVFRRAVDNAKPAVEVKSRRVGGSTYQVPVEVRSERQTALALRWLIEHARNRAGKSMDEKLANELIEASHNRGGAIKKKEDVHRMAEANKAFAHYRW